MARMKAVLAPLQAAALSLWVMPALVLAQANPQPGTPPGPRPIGPENMARDSGGSGLLWIIAALVVLAIIWWAMSSRRRHQTMTR